MKRLLWLGTGLAVGALVVRAVSKRARALTPQGLADTARNTVGGVAGSVRSFVEDVRTGMAEREEQIHTALAEAAAPAGSPAPAAGGRSGQGGDPGHRDPQNRDPQDRDTEGTHRR